MVANRENTNIPRALQHQEATAAHYNFENQYITVKLWFSLQIIDHADV